MPRSVDIATVGAILGQLVTWILVVVGWYFVNRKNNERETRKELRNALDEFHVFLDQIETQAVEYHTSASQDTVLATALKRDLHRRLPARINRLESRGLNTVDLGRPVVELRKAITLENFDSHSFAQRQMADSIITRIGIARDDLAEAIEALFAAQYR